MYAVQARDFESWREAARPLLAAHIPPDEVAWNPADMLFAEPLPRAASPVSIGAGFFDLAETVARHRDETRFDLLYRLAWRLTHENRQLMRILSDPLVRKLKTMERAVTHDVCRIKEFVRFRKLGDGETARYLAWVEPDHRSLALAAPFFVRRFADQDWAIFTPQESAHWDKRVLRLGPGADRASVPASDAAEDLWRTFYRAAYNPDRHNPQALRRLMPQRFWRQLPEGETLLELLDQGRRR
jgi:uracil-DNA glycosylase